MFSNAHVSMGAHWNEVRVDQALTLAERCRDIELLVLDVDGVLTDGAIVHGSAGLEVKAFHVRDGSALKAWTTLGKQAAILTGRRSSIVDVRAAELGIQRVHQGLASKRAAFRDLLEELQLPPAKACAIGDDLPDLGVLANCGMAVAVADACSEVVQAAHYVTQAPGGRGAAREVIELILRCQGTWQEIVERFREL